MSENSLSFSRLFNADPRQLQWPINYTDFAAPYVRRSKRRVDRCTDAASAGFEFCQQHNNNYVGSFKRNVIKPLELDALLRFEPSLKSEDDYSLWFIILHRA